MADRSRGSEGTGKCGSEYSLPRFLASLLLAPSINLPSAISTKVEPPAIRSSWRSDLWSFRN
jgi:hypothetical protein